MRAQFTKSTATFIREEGDPKFYGVRNAAGESRLFYHIVQFLNAHGFSVIKKRAWKDGHLLDEMQQYIRTRKRGVGPDLYLINPKWAIEGAEEDWNRKGCVTLAMEKDVWETGQPTVSMIQRLCESDLRLEWTH